MAKKLFGQTVVRTIRTPNGPRTIVMWGTIVSIIIGAPAVEYAIGLQQAIRRVIGLISWYFTTLTSWYSDLISNPFDGATSAIQAAWTSMELALQQQGLVSWLFAAVGSTLTLYGIYLGVTALYG